MDMVTIKRCKTFTNIRNKAFSVEEKVCSLLQYVITCEKSRKIGLEKWTSIQMGDSLLTSYFNSYFLYLCHG